MANKNPFGILNTNDRDDNSDTTEIDTNTNITDEVTNNKNYVVIKDNIVQFNIVTEDDDKNWNVINNKKYRRNHTIKQYDSIVENKPHSHKWFNESSWAHHYLIGHICDGNKIPFYTKDRKTKKLGELYQEIYGKHLTGIRKMYGYLATLQESFGREELSIWKHKYYTGIYCDEKGIPLYEMDPYRKEDALKYQQKHTNSKHHI